MFKLVFEEHRLVWGNIRISLNHFRKSLNKSLRFCLTAQSNTTALCFVPNITEPGAVYEIKLVAYNGNGESDCSKRLVSLAEHGMSDPRSGESD